MKTARQELDIINTYEETGSLRAAAALCGTTHKTVKRVLAPAGGWAAGGAPCAGPGVWLTISHI